ncbi:ABC transporter permease [Pseudactinotalea sp. Z1739]|uniref:ABC transporter permease n=1 Tax=Pseudactinotalea sp. Z1739 TaxID=3413028 RepID=UPI003C7AF58B
MSALAPLTGIVLVLVLAALTTPSFFSTSVLRLVLFQIGVIGIMAIGQTMVLLLGGIDLSLSAVVSMTSVVLAIYTGGSDERLMVGVLLCAVVGLAVGLLNAGLVVVRSVPPFVATFATFVLLQGVIIAWTRGAPSGRIPPGLGWLGSGRVLGIPVPALLFIAIAVVAGFILGRTTGGRRLYATGLNPDAARMSGIRVGLVTCVGYVVASLTGVLAGLINASFIGFVDSALVGSLDLNSIAAAVIGGIALAGGKGRIHQTVLGTILLAALLTWLIQLGAGGGAQLVVSGSVILLAVWLQKPTLNLRRHRRHNPQPAPGHT